MQAIKIPPMPGQSRSLLHFTPTTQIKREIDVVNVADAIKQEKENNAADGVGVDVVSAAGGPAGGTVKVTLDHDYFSYSAAPTSVPPAPSAAKRAKISILTPSRNRPLLVKEEEEEEVRFAI